MDKKINYQKTITLRVSVLENCQLRCLYCLPNGPSKLDKYRSLLNISDYQKITCELRKFPIKKIRFTGGEPLLRKSLDEIVAIFSSNFKGANIGLTTNGLLFKIQAKKLIEAGLNQVTFHLDTLNEKKYPLIMGRGSPKKVIEAMNIAKQACLPFKINMVVQRNVNHNELIEFLYFSRENNVQVRFIELMNTGSTTKYVENKFISGEEILSIIGEKLIFEKIPRQHLSDPAMLFFVPDLDIKFGLIASDTMPFCADCNRIRISATGKIRGCLYQNSGHSLRPSQANDNGGVEQNFSKALKEKRSYHPLTMKKRRIFSMSQTGG